MAKDWESPKLILLIRGMPEETILDACKSEGSSGLSPNDYNSGCEYYCESCQQLSAS